MSIQNFAKDLLEIYSSALLSIVILFSFFLEDTKYVGLRINVLWSIFFLFLSIIFSIPGLLEGFQWVEKWIGKDTFTSLLVIFFVVSLCFFLTSLTFLTYAFYKVYKINTLNIKLKESKKSAFVPDRVETGIEELDKALKNPVNSHAPGFMFNSTFLLRATPNSHPWIFWEKLCENLLKRDSSTYMLYICLNRPANVIIDEFSWNELPEMIENKRAYFIDGSKNVILNHWKDEGFVFNPFDINSLIRKIQKILFEEIKTSENKRVIIVVDSLSYIYKFSGNENALRFVFYLISLSSYYRVLNLLYYRKGFLSQEEEAALENAVDSIIDFEGHNNGKDKLKLTKIRLSKILNEEIEI
ncbi:RAD55 family ATPase [Desulfurobacterium sp.]